MHQTNIDNWVTITITKSRAPPLVKALPKKKPSKAKPLVEPKPSTFLDYIHRNEEETSKMIFDWAHTCCIPNHKMYVVTFTHTVDQIRAYNNAQLISLFCYKMLGFCKTTKSTCNYVIEYHENGTPHYHALVIFDQSNYKNVRSKLFNMLGDTLIGNVGSLEGKYIEEQWKKKKGKEYKVQTRTRCLKNVTDYMSKIKSKKKNDWYQVYDEHSFQILGQ